MSTIVLDASWWETLLEDSALIYYLEFTLRTPKWPQWPWDHFMVLVKQNEFTSVITGVISCIGVPPSPCFRFSYVKGSFRKDSMKYGAPVPKRQLLYYSKKQLLYFPKLLVLGSILRAPRECASGHCSRLGSLVKIPCLNRTQCE